jgi:HSP20 family protein
MDRGLNNNNLPMTAWKPKVDITETHDNKICFLVELPGVRKEDVQVDLEDRILTIRGSRRSEKNEINETWHRREIFHGNFTRSFNVGYVQADQIKAEMKDGLLQIKFPKVQEQPRPQGSRVEIQTYSA